MEESLGFTGAHLIVKDGHLATPTRGPQWIAPNLDNESGPDATKDAIGTATRYVNRHDTWLQPKGSRGFFDGWYESPRGGRMPRDNLHENGHLLRSWNSAAGAYDAVKGAT